MTNPNKAKGTRWESAVALHLQDHGFDVWRMAQTGEFDQGDLGGLPDFAFECRDRAKLDLAGNVKDANNRAKAKHSKYGVAVMKARGKKTADGYVVMDLDTFAQLLQDLYGRR